MEMINIEDYKDSTLAKLEEQKKQTVPIESKVALTIKEAAEYSNIGINKLESLLRLPRCPFVLYVVRRNLLRERNVRSSFLTTLRYSASPTNVMIPRFVGYQKNEITLQLSPGWCII